RKRAEEELARSEQALRDKGRLLQLVLDSMGEGLAAIDEQGKFLIWNNAANRILGNDVEAHPTEDFTGQYEIYAADGVSAVPAHDSPLPRAMQGEIVDTSLLLRRGPNMEADIWIDVSARPLRDPDGSPRGAVAAFRDVTKSKADEREIRKL